METKKISEFDQVDSIDDNTVVPVVKAGGNWTGKFQQVYDYINGKFAATLADKVSVDDTRLTDNREWTAATVSQAEAEAGTATARRAWTAQRVWQSITTATPKLIHSATVKPELADNDEFGYVNSAAGWGLVKLTWANIKAALSGLFVSKSGDTMTGNLLIERDLHADVTLRAFGWGDDGATLHGGYARGSKGAPTAPLSGDALFGIGARPYTGTKWAEHSTGAIHIFARENVSDTSQGTSFRVAVTPLGAAWDQRIHAVAFECDGVGQGARWRAKFSGALDARSYLQDNTGNGTTIGVLSGVDNGGAASLNLFSGTSPITSRYAQISNNTGIGAMRVFSGASPDAGALGAYPMYLEVEGSAVLVLGTDGTVTSRLGPLGYGPGAGGTVTQATSKTTPVTLNKPSGRITTHNAALAAGATVQFTINNSLVANTDLVVVNLNGNATDTGNYEVSCVATIGGGIVVNLRNISAGSLSDAVQINFAVIKGAVS